MGVAGNMIAPRIEMPSAREVCVPVVGTDDFWQAEIQIK